MKERPIIFSGPMVRAILDGRKTQTRRVVKSTGTIAPVDEDYEDWGDGIFGSCAIDGTTSIIYCPYGQPGDRLWVKEVWARGSEEGVSYYRESCPDHHGPWRSPLFMPRAASRITLEVESIRVERLDKITEEDARAEGVESVAAFAALWTSLYPDGPKAWAATPWVWVVGFRVLRR